MGIGVGVGVPVLTFLVIVIILIRRRKSSKALTELTGKTETERRNVPSPNSNKILPTSEPSADEIEKGGKHTALGNYKASEPSLTSATMLTHPDVTTDEAPDKQSKQS